MRRKDREVTNKEEIESILKEATVCRLGLSQGNVPYIVPLNFGYIEDCLYFHCAKGGMKMDILRSNNRVCFEVDFLREITDGPEACDWSAKYKSVIGFGNAFVLEDREEKKKGLNAIMEKYSGIASHKYSDGQLDRVAVIKVEITGMTGKSSI